MKLFNLLTVIFAFIFSISCGDSSEVDEQPLVYYTVYFYTNGGSTLSSVEVEQGAVIAEPATPTKSGYIFNGWHSNSGLTDAWDFSSGVYSDMTLYASWTIASGAGFTATFETNGGSEIAPIGVLEGETLTQPDDPTKSGYALVGWYTDEACSEEWDFSTVLTEDITLYALWEVDNSSKTFSVSLIGTHAISDLGFHAEGTLDVDYAFGPHMTPSGDCITISGGYIFFAWWERDPDNWYKCNLRLSRKHITGTKWVTIEFDWFHVGYNGQIYNGTGVVADSHNYPAVGICELDGTVHLIYDMHSFSVAQSAFNFNYNVSGKGIAYADDSEFTIDNFEGRLATLDNGETYEELTYPKMIQTTDRKLILNMRYGGTGKGDHIYFCYDGDSWSTRQGYNLGFYNPVANSPENYSIYGDFKSVNGNLVMINCVRYYQRESQYTNTGFHYGVIEEPFGTPALKDLYGTEYDIPLWEIENLRLFEPEKMGFGESITTSPSWVITDAGDIHAVLKVTDPGNGSTYMHFWRPAGSEDFQVSTDSAGAYMDGDLYVVGDKIINIGIRNKLRIRVCTAGTDSWEEVYLGDSYDLCETYFDEENGVIVAVVMDYGAEGDKCGSLKTLTFSIYSF